jgi:hypothetical protein
VKVLYLLGTERGGSTVAGNLIGGLEGFFAAGEVRALWRDLAAGDTRCGCGRPLRECELWPRIAGGALTAKGDGLSHREVYDLQLETVRFGHSWLSLPRLLRLRDANEWPALHRYGQILEHVYAGVAAATGCRVIVDTSKEPTDALLLTMLPSVQPYFVHVVRDPRGVLYSCYRLWDPVGLDTTRALDPEGSHPVQAAHISGHWLLRNGSIDVARRRLGPVLRISYEELAAAPGPVLERVAAFVDEGDAALPPIHGSAVELAPSHTVAGNRSRFETGAVEVRPDNAWVDHLHRADGAVATALSLPLLRRYGYPAGRPRPR